MENEIYEAIMGTPVPVELTAGAKRVEINKNINFVDLVGRRKICQTISFLGFRDKLIPCAEGLIINLDVLPDKVIDTMYNEILSLAEF
jgi:hypothetical protein